MKITDYGIMHRRRLECRRNTFVHFFTVFHEEQKYMLQIDYKPCFNNETDVEILLNDVENYYVIKKAFYHCDIAGMMHSPFNFSDFDYAVEFDELLVHHFWDEFNIVIPTKQLMNLIDKKTKEAVNENFK